jgi:CHAT domain-containing protein
LRETRNNARATRDSGLVERERQLRKELNYWSWLVWQQSDRADPARLNAAQSQIDRLEDERRVVEGNLRRSDPQLTALLRPDPVPLSTIQLDVLDKDTVLLDYWLGEEASHLWAITHDEVRVFDLPSRAIIERQARRFYDLVSNRPAEESAAESSRVVQREARALGRVLLASAAGALDHRRVLIVADGALHYTPFAAWPDPRDAAALAAHHEIVTVASATTLALLRRENVNRPPAAKTLAIFADPVFDRADPRVKLADSTAAAPAADFPPRRRFPRLPFSRDEAEQIVSLVPAASRLTALDFEASRSVATNAAISQYEFVHFATHAVQNDRHPELSGIVLSLVDASGHDQDGFLRLHDLYDLRLNASLVVLSACETGLGKQVSGEGLIGFAQGLFSAGAARVVSTLWKVDDEATATLMQLFYQNLLVLHAAPADALRAAQASMMMQRRWREPYYWSGFVLQGSW